jgi:hypothetical protein
VHFNSLSLFRRGRNGEELMGFSSFRRGLEGFSYPDLVNHEAEYNKHIPVGALTAQPLPEIRGKTSDEVHHVARSYFPKTMNGRGLRDKNVSGGWAVDYGNSVGDIRTPKTTFWINARPDKISEALHLLDECLQGCHAQMKLNTNALGKVAENPQERPSDLIAIYLNGTDEPSIQRLLERMAARQADITLLLRPEEFHKVMTTFRIPVTPGITFVERPDGNSWDTNYKTYMEDRGGLGWGGMQNPSVWQKLSPHQRANGLRSVRWAPGRSRNMPGLRAA